MKQISWPGLILGCLILALIGFAVYLTENPWVLFGLWTLYFVKIDNPTVQPKVVPLDTEGNFPREEISVDELPEHINQSDGLSELSTRPLEEDGGKPRVLH